MYYSLIVSDRVIFAFEKLFAFHTFLNRFPIKKLKVH